MSAVAVTVSILDREYQIACTTEEQASLHAAAAYLDEKMREIRDRGTVIGADRIAVMAALNIANDLLMLKPLEAEHQSLSQHISSLRDVVSRAIASEDIITPNLLSKAN